MAMNITGPITVTPVQKPDESTLTLRVNQRVVAEVLQISGDTVTLALQGTQVVARLTSSDQAEALQERKVAQFVVRDLSPNNILMQLVGTLPGQTGAVGELSQNLAANLLRMADMPVTEENQVLLQSMLSEGLPADAAVMEDLRGVLNSMGKWGDAEARIASALKNAGLPVTPGAIALVQTAPQELGQVFTNLFGQLTALANRTALNPGLAETARQALALLQTCVLDWNTSPQSLADNLRQAISTLGRSVEHDLANMVRRGETHLPGAGTASLLTLAGMREEFLRAGQRGIVEELDRFIDGMRYLHLSNAEASHAPASGEWANMEIPLRLAFPPANNLNRGTIQWNEAHLKIAYQKEEEGRKVNPAYTHLVIEVDLNQEEAVEVELAIAGKQVGVQVTTSTAPLRDIAIEEILSLADGLAKIGFEVKKSQCEVGKISQNVRLGMTPISAEILQRVNVEA
jgi:hypothetical protein